MKLVTPSFYKGFKCLAGACPDSCCQGWEVDVDPQTLEYYSSISADIKNRIDAVLDKDEFDNTIFAPTAQMRCPFLNSDNLCDIHIALGVEHTPYTCRTFPVFINDYGSLRETGMALSCPVAADMTFYLKDEFGFKQEINDLPPTPNDIDAQLYFTLIKARQQAYDIACDSNLHMRGRMIKLLDYAADLQQSILPYDDDKRSEDISFTDVFRYPELINSDWTERLDKAVKKAVPNDKWCENILMYFLYRYFLTAVNDKDVLSKVKMAVAGVLIILFSGADSWAAHLWSKETEHSDLNMEHYKKMLKNAKSFSVSSLKEIIK